MKGTPPTTCNSTSDQLPELLDWLEQFKAENGRPLRVLHVGNIASNGYLNARFLRSVGVEADIVSRDYYHVMAFPEWEDLEINHAYGDDFDPVFSAKDLKGYERPEWFFSGPLAICAAKIAFRYANTDEGASIYKREALARLMKRMKWGQLAEAVREKARRLFGRRTGNAVLLAMLDPREFSNKLAQVLPLPFLRKQPIDMTQKNKEIAKEMVSEFDRLFPDRKDRLSVEDALFYLSNREHFATMFAPYDIVQCYATEPLNALLAGKHPYVAFEHGTLRSFTLGDDPLHRLTALGYRKAAHSFITNGDCLTYAEKIGLESYSPIVHPIDVEQHRLEMDDEIAALRQKIGADVVLFCPVRHDFDVKGTDIHLKALPLLKKRLDVKVRLVLVKWGMQVEDSVRILEENGCSGDVIWETSMSRVKMIKFIRAADVVLDQMALPHFGSTAPQSMAAGTPVISSFKPESITWMFPQAPPILPAFSPEEVVEAVITALDSEWRAVYKDQAKEWMDKYHHPNQVVENHLRVYRKILSNVRQSK